MTERKKNVYVNCEDKAHIIKSLKNGETVSELATKYCVSKTKIYSIKRNHDTSIKSLKSLNGNGLSTGEEELKTMEGREYQAWLENEDMEKNCGEYIVPEEKETIAFSVQNKGMTEENLLCVKVVMDDASPSKETSNVDRSTILLVSNPPHLSNDQNGFQDKATLILSNDPLVKMDELLSLEESSENILCSSYEKFQEILSNFETDTYTKYIITKTKGPFTEEEVSFVQRRIRLWEEGQLSGVPYIVVATRYFSCHHGAPTNTNVLAKYAQKRKEQEKLGLCNKYQYKKHKGPKKLGCPVKFVAHRLLIFPDLQVPHYKSCSSQEKKDIKRTLQKSFNNFRFESRYSCVLPDTEKHQYHKTGPSSGVKEAIDPRVLQKIKDLVGIGKTDPDDIAELLEDFVKQELHVYDKNRIKFYPSRLGIIQVVNRAKLKLRLDSKEEKEIALFLSTWGLAEDLFFRPMGLDKDANGGSGSTFLFVYQNKEMKRLLRLYGRKCVFLDAIHRTCEYVWPFYLLIVNTNSTYQVVGFYATQHESKTTIAEGLQLLMEWNPEVRPKYIIINRPWEEARALEYAFPDVKIFVSAHHRERTWQRKMNRRENDGINRKEVLSRLQQVAEAASESDLRRAIALLKDSEDYKSSTMKTYYESSWHQQLKKWTAVYKPRDLDFERNDGARRLDEDIRYDYLSELRTKPLSTIIDSLIKEYIPSKLTAYRRENAKALRKYQFSQGIPPYLREYSEWVMDQVLVAHMEATEECEHYFVQYTSNNSFIISYVGDTKFHEVSFDPAAKVVSCNCPFFKWKNVICKHVIIVGLKHSEWHLSRISCWLFDNPIYKIDNGCTQPLDKSDVSSLEVVVDNIQVKPQRTREKVESVKFQHSLQDKCKSELKSLESILVLLDGPRLQMLLTELKKVRENCQVLNCEEYLRSYLEPHDATAIKEGEINNHQFISQEGIEEMVIEIDKLS